MMLATAVMSLWSAFATPPESARPWCYWFWVNGHVDNKNLRGETLLEWKFRWFSG